LIGVQETAMVIVLMGVSGSGKTTIGKVLAEALGWTFVEADEFHPSVNVEKMRQGIPLNDEDRKPWLAALRQRMDEGMDRGENIVLACSALKHAYQEYLDQLDPPHIHFVYLHGPGHPAKMARSESAADSRCTAPGKRTICPLTGGPSAGGPYSASSNSSRCPPSKPRRER
jgi:carbohydrate kinase (thermoresistant glucokinase family)